MHGIVLYFDVSHNAGNDIDVAVNSIPTTDLAPTNLLFKASYTRTTQS